MTGTLTGGTEGAAVLAAHPLISAVPFFVPTFIVVAVIGVIIWRDRRHDDDRPTDPDTPPNGVPYDGGGEAQTSQLR